eukprot:3092067-Rhodomonas_salina.2
MALIPSLTRRFLSQALTEWPLQGIAMVEVVKLGAAELPQGSTGSGLPGGGSRVAESERRICQGQSLDVFRSMPS